MAHLYNTRPGGPSFEVHQTVDDESKWDLMLRRPDGKEAFLDAFKNANYFGTIWIALGVNPQSQVQETTRVLYDMVDIIHSDTTPKTIVEIRLTEYYGGTMPLDDVAVTALSTLLEQCRVPRLHGAVALSPGGAFVLDRALRTNQWLVSALVEEGWQGLGDGIGNNRTLQKLDIDAHHDVELNNEEGMIKFFNGLKVNSSVQDLHISDAVYSPDVAAALGDAIAENGTLRRLELQYEVDDEGFLQDRLLRQVGRGLRHNTSLRHLAIGFDPFQREGFETFAMAFRDNQTVETLEMVCFKQVGPVGVTHMRSILLASRSVKKLHLFISGEGGVELCRAIGEGLARNVVLDGLYLDLDAPDDEFRIDDLEPITTALELHNRTVKTLDIDGRQFTIGLEAANRFKAMLLANDAMKKLTLRCRILEESAHVIVEALADNSTLNTLNIGVGRADGDGIPNIVETTAEEVKTLLSEGRNRSLCHVDLWCNSWYEAYNEIIYLCKRNEVGYWEWLKDVKTWSSAKVMEAIVNLELSSVDETRLLFDFIRAIPTVCNLPRSFGVWRGCPFRRFYCYECTEEGSGDE